MERSSKTILFPSLQSGHSNGYEKVDQDEDGVERADGESVVSQWHSRQLHLLRIAQLSIGLNVLLAMFSAHLYILSQTAFLDALEKFYVFCKYSTIGAATLATDKHTAPFTDTTILRFKDMTINGTLYPAKHHSFSRAEPGEPAAEAIWEALEMSAMFPISREQLLKTGKDPSTAVQFADSIFGLGDEAYVASLDVQHKMHCLNELRKSTFANYPGQDQQYFSGNDHDWSYRNSTHSKLWWVHLRHCVDVLAQDLMCHADSEVMTYTWRDMNGGGPATGLEGLVPYPEMSINRKCRDWGQLMEWQDERKVDAALYARNIRYDPDGPTRLLPHERHEYDESGFEDSILFPGGDGFDEYFAGSRQ